VKPLHKLLIGTLLLLAAIAGFSLAHILRPAQLPPPPMEQQHPASRPESLIGVYRPDFSLPDLTDRMRSIGEWDGRVLLINFWATWCSPCREEIPALMAGRRQFQAQGFEIVGIAIDQPEFVTEYARNLAIAYPLLYGSEDAIAIGSAYGNQQGTLPYSVFISADGHIAHIHNSGVLGEHELTQIVKGLLNGSTENEPKRSKLP
jgi:peroxiredoxin